MPRRLMMKEENIVADVLCVGGGIAGLMAAISAAQRGAKVVVAEKANTLRSGAGTTGNDHFRCYIPDFHGPDIQPVVQQEMNRLQLRCSRPTAYVKTWMERSFDIVKLWDSWGIQMKHDGKWDFTGHGIPGRPLPTLKYKGQNQKPILTQQAIKRGVTIINRVMVYDLICGDGIAGAVGIDTREQKRYKFQAKSVMIGTGNICRLYPSPTPGWMFNRAYCPATTGDGRAMSYRAGAELVNMEMPSRWAGPKYFARCGKGSWIGVVRDSSDKTMGPFVSKPDRRYGDAIADTNPGLFDEMEKAGRGPLFMDCRGISEADYEYMMAGLKHEGNVPLLNHLKEENIDIRKNAVEFMTYELAPRGAIDYNEKGEASLKGLYAAGDENFGGISNAAVFGWIAGENAAEFVKKVDVQDISKIGEAADQRTQLIDKMLSRKSGAGWQEVNIALSQIMQDYAGQARTDSLLQAGLGHLRRLKIKAENIMLAGNQHEAIRCLEVLNLFELAELLFMGLLERKETRGNYRRFDYPFVNPILDGKVIIYRKVADKPVIEWREAKN
jgi:succinate dehydrogenase/fumarate reductase flavoprotein subunit